MLFISDEQDDTCRYPFFIQWGESDEARTKTMAPLMQHSVGHPSLSYIGVSASNIDKSLEKYCYMFDVTAESIKQNFDEFGTYSEFSLGNISIRLYAANNLQVESNSDLINRPFLCGITGMPETRTIQLKNGIYQFSL